MRFAPIWKRLVRESLTHCMAYPLGSDSPGTGRSIRNQPRNPITQTNSLRPFATALRQFHPKRSPIEARLPPTDWPTPTGLYSWWVHQAGVEDLSRGRGLLIECGLIYGGLAGATQGPSGKRSNNTLWLRVMTLHLSGNHEFSTFRSTLGSILAGATGAARIDEMRLTQWMNAHLRIVTIPFEDSDALGRLERDVLERLDPPLNLQSKWRVPRD
jgi:hypothetical protein